MVEIVSSHFRENLSWLKESAHPVHVVGKEGGDPLSPSDFASLEIIPNLGHEALSYLRYIVREYDSFPESVAFIHGHEHNLHQRSPLLTSIDLYGHLPFADLNRTINVHFSISQNFPRRFRSLWDLLLRPKFGTEMPRYVNFRLGAQFVVSKDVMRANSKDFYSELYSKTLDFLASDPSLSKDAAMFYEWFWHLLFGAESPLEDRARTNVFFCERTREILYENFVRPNDYVDMFMHDFKICGPTEFMKNLVLP